MPRRRCLNWLYSLCISLCHFRLSRELDQVPPELLRVCVVSPADVLQCVEILPWACRPTGHHRRPRGGRVPQGAPPVPPRGRGAMEDGRGAVERDRGLSVVHCRRLEPWLVRWRALLSDSLKISFSRLFYVPYFGYVRKLYEKLNAF